MIQYKAGDVGFYDNKPYSHTADIYESCVVRIKADNKSLSGTISIKPSNVGETFSHRLYPDSDKFIQMLGECRLKLNVHRDSLEISHLCKRTVIIW